MSKAVGLFLKLVILSGLAVIILIALYMVDGVITDRKTYRDQATQSISESYAQQQRLVGPILVQPFSRDHEGGGDGREGREVSGDARRRFGLLNLPDSVEGGWGAEAVSASAWFCIACLCMSLMAL